MEQQLVVSVVLIESLSLGNWVTSNCRVWVTSLWNVVLFQLVGGALDNSEFNYGHLILGQSSGFVGADNSGASKSLNWWQSSNDSIVLSHFSCSKSEACGNNCWESLRNSSYGQSNRDLEIIDASLHETSVDVIVHVLIVHDPHQEANDTNQPGKFLSKVIKLLLEWGIFLVFCSFLNLFLYSTDSSIHASENNDTCGITVVNDRWGENHVLLVLQQIAALDFFSLFWYWHGFTCQWGLFDLERYGIKLSYSNIGWNVIADSDLNDISWYELLTLLSFPLTVSQDLAVDGLHVLQSF